MYLVYLLPSRPSSSNLWSCFKISRKLL